jgi:D-serine dehydratase
MADVLVDGIYTVEDDELFKNLAMLRDSEGIKIEPSAAASLSGPTLINPEGNAVHICWATGGLFLPDEIYEGMYEKGRNLLR